MLEEPSQRGKLGGDRGSCWLADGEHLQHRGLPKKEQAAASSSYAEKLSARERDGKQKRCRECHQRHLSTGPGHFSKPKNKVPAQPRSPSLR